MAATSQAREGSRTDDELGRLASTKWQQPSTQVDDEHGKLASTKQQQPSTQVDDEHGRLGSTKWQQPSTQHAKKSVPRGKVFVTPPAWSCAECHPCYCVVLELSPPQHCHAQNVTPLKVSLLKCHPPESVGLNCHPPESVGLICHPPKSAHFRNATPLKPKAPINYKTPPLRNSKLVKSLLFLRHQKMAHQLVQVAICQMFDTRH